MTIDKKSLEPLSQSSGLPLASLCLIGIILFLLMMVPVIKWISPDVDVLPVLGFLAKLIFGTWFVVWAIFKILTLTSGQRGASDHTPEGPKPSQSPVFGQRSHSHLRATYDSRFKLLALLLLIGMSALLFLGSPIIFAAFVMAFDAPGSTENIRLWIFAITIFGLPYFVVFLGWIFYGIKRYKAALLAALTPVGLLVLLQVWSFLASIFSLFNNN